MSNIAVFNPKANVPAFAKQGAITAVAKALAGNNTNNKRISVRGGTFRLIVGGEEVAKIEERYLDIVIVAAAPKISRTFYVGTFDAENPTAPDCWSADGDRPDPAATNKQCDSCAQCPQNVKGSGQGDSKACRYSQRLAVVLANDVEGDVLQLSLAATSIFGKEEGDNRPLQAYARYLLAQGIDPSHVITRMKFDTSASTPKLFFKPMRYLSEEEYAICQEQGASADALSAITMTVAQADNVKTPPRAAPAPAPAQVAQRPAPAPQVDEEPPAPPPTTARRGRPPKSAAPAAPAQEEAPEPQVRTSAPPTVNVPSNNLQATLDAWGDDD